MKLVFLGTAAAEGYPGVFCECGNCRKARERGGRNIRSRSSLLINDLVLIDIPQDTYMHTLRENVHLSQLRILMITHSHVDHFNPEILRLRRDPFCLRPLPMLKVYSNETVYNRLCEVTESIRPVLQIDLEKVEPFVTHSFLGYSITTVKANHMQNETALNYIVSKDGRTLLYAVDTGPYGEETLDFLEGFRFDCLVAEATMGYHDGNGHMSFKSVLSFKDWCVKMGLMKTNAPFICSHFSHGGCPIHDEIVGYLDIRGVLAAHDGMSLEI